MCELAIKWPLCISEWKIKMKAFGANGGLWVEFSCGCGHLQPPRPGNTAIEWIGNNLYPHVLKVVWENCLRHLRNIARVYMSFSRHYHWNMITNCYFYRWNSSDPLPLYAVKIENFHLVLTLSLKRTVHRLTTTSFFWEQVVVLKWESPTRPQWSGEPRPKVGLWLSLACSGAR